MTTLTKQRNNDMTLFTKEQLAELADAVVDEAAELDLELPDEESKPPADDNKGVLIGHADRKVAKGMSRFTRPQ